MISWLSCTLFILLAIGISGQTNSIDHLRASNAEKGYPFGKLRLSEDGKKEELIFSMDTEKPAFDQDQQTNGQPLPSPCLGTAPSTKLAYPKDKTKYIQCRDEFHYEILTCPNNSEYVEQSTSCELVLSTIDRCEAEKPCLNDGKCSILSNSTLKCTCQKNWVGERCETPLNSCVTKPCGPNADCRPLKTIEKEQDYVCLCHGSKDYGLSCREVVPNPCLTTSEQFFPYAFSQRAYVQCNGELIYFQPCGSSLYWDQEAKICDRKPPAKIETPTLITKVIAETDNQQEINVNDETRTTTVATEQEIASVPNGKEDNEAVFAFVPARIANRQQFQSNLNNQQGEKESKSSEISNQRFQVTDNTNQWTNQQTDTNIRQPLTMQSNRQQQQQQWPQSTVQQWSPKPVVGFSTNANLGQSQIKQTLPQNQVFSNQQWSNQIPNVKSQSWEGSQTFQNQDTLLDTTTTPQTFVRFRGQPQSWQNQQTFLETTTLPLEDFQNLPEEFWQSKPIDQSTQQGQSFFHHPQSWQGSQKFLETTTPPQNLVRFQDQSWQQRPISQSFVNQPFSWQNKNQQQLVPETTTPTQTSFNFPSQKFQNQEQSWQTKPLTQPAGNQFSQTNSLNTQMFVGQPQSWQTSQTVQNQQNSKPSTLEGSTIEKNNRVNTGVQQNSQWSIKPQTTQTQQSWQTQGTNQFRPESESSMINTPRLRLNNEQTISSPARLNQQWSSISDSDSSADLNDAQASRKDEGIQSQNTQQQQQIFPQQNQVFSTQQRFTPQTFIETSTVLPQKFQIPQQQDQPWQNQFLTQQTSSQPIKSQANQVFAFKPKPWPVETQKVNDQDTPQTSQFWSQIPNQQPLMSKPSTSQFSNQASQFTNLDDTRSIIASQPWSQSGKLTGNSFETTSTVPTKTPLQVLLPLSARNWQAGRTNDQQTMDQRLPLDSWKSRS